MRRGDDCLSDLTLDRLRGGELPREGAIAAHLDGCSECASRLGEMEAVRQELLTSIPLRRRGPRAWPIAAVAALAAAAGLIVALRVVPSGDVTRTKGGARLGFHVKRGAKTWLGEDGERVRPGDALRFTVAPHGRRWVAVLSRDGAGHGSVYQPPIAVGTVGSGDQIALPLAIALDDVLGRELLVGLFCDQAPDVGRLVERLEREGDLAAAPPRCELDRLRIEKERAP